MMGQCCKTQCGKLSTDYAQAINNLELDCDPKKGNIPASIVNFMEQCCGAGKNIVDFIGECGVLKKPDDYTHLKYSAEPELELRRVVSVTTFIKYHISNAGYSALSIKEHLVAEYAQGKVEIFGIQNEIEQLDGRTHLLGRTCWWTFNIPDLPEPPDGKTYILELALFERTRTDIEAEGAFIEIILKRSQLSSVNLFKPTSVEGFSEVTPFFPELTGLKHGLTKPIHPASVSRPELVSESFSYQDLNIETIKIKYWNYP